MTDASNLSLSTVNTEQWNGWLREHQRTHHHWTPERLAAEHINWIGVMHVADHMTAPISLGHWHKPDGTVIEGGEGDPLAINHGRTSLDGALHAPRRRHV